MKKCSKCKQSKPLDDFNISSRAKDGHQAYCRNCSKVHGFTHYRAPDGVRREKVRKVKADAVARNVTFIVEYLDSHPCVLCGTDENDVLQFDHVPDRGPKIAGVVSLAYQGYSIKRIQQEIDLCQVLCANCHMRVTASRRWIDTLKKIKGLA